MKLLWYLGDWWLWTFFLFALLVMPVMAEGTWSVLPVIASLGLVLSLQPDFQKYQLVGLGSRIWNEHRRTIRTSGGRGRSHRAAVVGIACLCSRDAMGHVSQRHSETLRVHHCWRATFERIWLVPPHLGRANDLSPAGQSLVWGVFGADDWLSSLPV